MLLNFVLLLCFSILEFQEVSSSITIEDVIYSAETTAKMNQLQAAAYCHEQNSELANVNERVLRELSVTTAPKGSFWIDGVDENGEKHFVVSSTCAEHNEAVNFTGIPEDCLKLRPSTCLTIAKREIEEPYKIESKDCRTKTNGVLCATYLNGCPPKAEEDQQEETTTDAEE